MANRFKETEPTLQELSYISRGMVGDFEAVLLFIESRQIEKFDIRDLPMSAIVELMEELASAMGGEPIKFDPSISEDDDLLTELEM